jgi:MoaA/NifB/PqqE/SkfB family radical SAM enzyme
VASLKRRIRKTARRWRETRMLIHAFRFQYQPVAAHVIPIRRCNIACAYCNEFDDHSSPVATPEMLRRIDLLAALGTSIVTMSGGEPLLHPDLDDIIRRVRARGMIATLITNGYLLSVERIRQLNDAGLDHLQISIDNVLPDDVSKKSLKLIDKKLQWLAEHAEFDVTINSVVGGGIRQPDDALVIARRARTLGFSTTVGIIHDGHGGLAPLDEQHRSVLERIVASGSSLFDFANYNRFQKHLTNGQPNDWHCRAGARYLYVCEDGLVHWCSQQRGTPGIPLERYTVDDIRREFMTPKWCAPYCTIGCVHRVSTMDFWRRPQIQKTDVAEAQ